MAALIVSSLSDLQSPVEERLEALNYCHNVLIEDKALLDDIGWSVLEKILQNCLTDRRLHDLAFQAAIGLAGVLNPKLCHLACMESLTYIGHSKEEDHGEEEEEKQQDSTKIVARNRITECYLQLFQLITIRSNNQFRMRSVPECLRVLADRFDRLLIDKFTEFVSKLFDYSTEESSDDEYKRSIREAALYLVSNSTSPKVLLQRFPLLCFQHAQIPTENSSMDYGRAVLSISTFNAQSPAVWTPRFAFNNCMAAHIAQILSRPQDDPDIIRETFEIARNLLKRCKTEGWSTCAMQDHIYGQQFLPRLIGFMSECPIAQNRLTAYRLLEQFLTVFEDAAQMEFFITLLRQCPYPNVKTALIQLLQKCIHQCNNCASPMRSRVIIDVLVPEIFHSKTLLSQTISYHLQALNFLTFLILTIVNNNGKEYEWLRQTLDEIVLRRLQSEYLVKLRGKQWNDREDEFNFQTLEYCLDRIDSLIAQL